MTPEPLCLDPYNIEVIFDRFVVDDSGHSLIGFVFPGIPLVDFLDPWSFHDKVLGKLILTHPEIDKYLVFYLAHTK